jgi:hypothetical protein
VKTLRFSWAEYEAMITEDVISGWELYEGEGRRANTVNWAITMNGGSLSRDIADRTVVIKLARSEYDGNWWEAVVKYIKDHRESILVEVRDLLIAPPPEGFTVSSRWSEWETAVLSKVHDPQACQVVIARRRQEIDADAEETTDVRTYFAKRAADNGTGNPDTTHILIASQAAAQWLSEATRKDFATNAATVYLQGLRIPELVRVRTTHTRGWAWRGVNSPAKPSNELRPPPQAPQFPFA